MTRLALLFLALSSIARGAEPTYEAYAVRYATLSDFPVSALVQGADKDRKLDIAMTILVLKGDGRVVLVDSGFYREKYLREWTSITNFTRPDKAVARLGIKPEEVTDVIISHSHWDHCDGTDLFPKATVWIQKAEYEHYTPGAGKDDHLLALIRLKDAGRVRMVEGDKMILPGIAVYIGGKHTFESQYVGVNTRAGTMVIASDNVYLYENLDKHVPIAETVDAKANLVAQDRMRKIATDPRLIIPGHDPAVFARFPKVADGVARLD